MVPNSSTHFTEETLTSFRRRQRGTFDDLQEFGDFKIYIPNHVTNVPAASIIGSDSSMLMAPGFEYNFPEVSMTMIHNAQVSNTGAVFYEDKVISETIEGRVEENVIGIGMPIQDIPSFVSVSRYGNFNHAVFMAETLPLIYLAQLDGQASQIPRAVLFDENFCSYEYRNQHQNVIDRISPSGVVTDERASKAFNVERLIVPVVSRRLGASRASLLSRYLSHALIRSYQGGYETKSLGNIYVSRRYANSRVPDNIDRLEEIASSEGFRVVHIENLSIPEQIETFRNASNVLAEHGAGLINLMFCPPTTRVVEMFPAAMYGHWTFRLVAYVNNLQYATSSFPVKENWRFNEDSVYIDPDLFARCAKFLSRSS